MIERVHKLVKKDLNFNNLKFSREARDNLLKVGQKFTKVTKKFHSQHSSI